MEHHKELLNLILDRRSCREYLSDPLERPVLAAIVEAGRYAPSAMDRQLAHFYVVTAPKLLASITRLVSQKLPGFAGRDCLHGAPALVVVTNRADNPMAKQDTGCAMENMMLAACAMGVGSCWVNQLHDLSGDPDLRALFASAGLGGDERIYASLGLGLPAGPLFSGRVERTGNHITWLSKE